MKKLSLGATVFAAVVPVFVAFVVANPIPYVSSPVYRQDPRSGTTPSSSLLESSLQVSNKTYVVSYV